MISNAFRKTLKETAGPVLSMPRTLKRAVAILIDVELCFLAVWLAYYLRLGESIPLDDSAFLWPVLAAIVISLPIFIISGFYRSIFRYNGWPALVAVARAIGIYGIVYTLIFAVIGVPSVPRTIGIIQPILLFLLVSASRVFVRLWLGDHYRNILTKASRPKALVYGGGSAGRQLAAAMGESQEIEVVGFLDDKDHLHGYSLNGIPVHNPNHLESLVQRLGITHVFLAMPKITRHRRNQIIERLQNAHVTVRTLPSFDDLVKGRVTTTALRDLDIDDLLGRETVIPDQKLLEKSIFNKIVLVTGAGGSIGSEICRQILEVGPRKLLMVDQNEFALYTVHDELHSKFGSGSVALVPLLASVQDETRMREIMSAWSPQTVYHTAAYKHVPLVEHNPAVAIINNVFGTLRSAKAAILGNVEDFVLISTDKAVRPTNIMGASKRLAEKILQALAAEKRINTKFSMVRFGNVLDSSGSVVPRFRQQIRDGGPITLTHPEIIRYFMTIPEAAQLVIQAGSMARGGDVFVLDMGKPVKIYDLAKKMVELSGATIKNQENPNGDIEIVISGLRPGEKLYEELLIGKNSESTSHPKILRAHEQFIPWESLHRRLNELEEALKSNDLSLALRVLEEMVSGYTRYTKIVDWAYLEQAAHGVHIDQ